MKVLVIEKKAIRRNVAVVKERAGSSAIYAVLTRDGYGAGLVELAKLLREEGYPELSHIVRVHHGMAGGEEYRLTEASLVFLADKYMQGDKRVSLEERFEKSRAKCRTPEGMENHQKQYRQAAAIKRNLEYILGENT